MDASEGGPASDRRERGRTGPSRRSTGAMLVGLALLSVDLGSGSRCCVTACLPPRRQESRSTAELSLSRRALELLQVVEREHPDDVDLRRVLFEGLAAARRQAAVVAAARTTNAAEDAEDAVSGNAEPHVPNEQAHDSTELPTLEILLAELDRLESAARRGGDSETVTRPDAVLMAIAEGVPGGARYVDAAARKVDEQLRQNRYVGIGIRLRSDEGDAYIESTFYGGPAAEAGLQAGDRFVTIDGVSTVGLPLGDVVERLRGPLGSTLETTVWRDGRALTVRMTRTEVPIATIESLERIGKDRWNVALPEEPRVAWLKFVRVAGSSVAELRSLLRQADEQGCRAALIDLRECDECDPHQVELLADLLTDGGSIGEREIGSRRETIRSQPGGVWLDRPLVLLVDAQTAPELAWGVAAIARRDDVRVIGSGAAYRAMVREDRELADGGLLAGLPIGRLRPVAEGIRRDERPANEAGAFRLDEIRSIPASATGSERSPTDDPARDAGIEIAQELLAGDRPK